MFFLLVIPQAFTAIGLFCCTTARLAVCMAVLMFMVITSSFSILHLLTASSFVLFMVINAHSRLTTYKLLGL